jgi:hypothetical protein
MGMSLEYAKWLVSTNQIERICAPGQWKVWRDADGVHSMKIMAGN